MNKNRRIGVIAILLLVGIGFFALTKQNSKPSPSVITTTAGVIDDWKIYTNTKYGYSIKYPSTLTPIETIGDVIYLHQVQFKDPKVTSISGITVEVRTFTTLVDEITYRKWTVEGHIIPGKIDSEEPITVSGVPGTILNYTSGEERFSITIVPYQKLVYTIIAPSNQLGLYNQLISSFKIVTPITSFDKAVKILQAIPEIQIIENAVIKNGRKTFFMQGDINEDVVKVWLYEGGFPDQHTTRIDTFNVNIMSQVITIDDVAMTSGRESITLEEWKKTVKERFQ